MARCCALRRTAAVVAVAAAVARATPVAPGLAPAGAPAYAPAPALALAPALAPAPHHAVALALARAFAPAVSLVPTQTGVQLRMHRRRCSDALIYRLPSISAMSPSKERSGDIFTCWVSEPVRQSVE
eukprot:13584434-Alexandrium_andersonii.AAC.1